MNNSPSFRTRARVICQLGEQLIKNEAIALLELIKNSYDADASTCNVTMHSLDSTEEGEIIIEDDGEGMDYQTLSTAWLEVGTSYKEDLLGDNVTMRSKNFGRLRLGEKGIGRFGVHRLGREIEVVTRKDNSKECVLNINWDKIENSRYIEDLPIKLFEQRPKLFTSGTGTRIRIRRLRRPWTRQMARSCARSITSLNSPFEGNDSFRVTFGFPNNGWLDDILRYEDVEQYKLFSFDVTMENSDIVDFTYKFSPWETMKKLSHKCITTGDAEIRDLMRMIYKNGRDYLDINLSKYKIGKVRFKGIIFDLDAKTLDLGVQDKRGLKKYLDENGGVRVFRDNMRVLDYGEPNNDWLDLGGRRVNLPTGRISRNIILAAVYLDRSSSTDLVEKANREGFVENEAYNELKRAIEFSLNRIVAFRNIDKNLLRSFYGPQDISKPVLTCISELRDVIDSKVKDEPARKEINRYLDRIERDYETITESLITSAGAGLNLVVVIHQIEKVIKEIKAMLKSNVLYPVLEGRVKELSSLVDGYSILVKKSEKKVRNLKDIIEQSIFNIEFRLKAHRIELDPAFRKRTANVDALCSVSHAANALMNIFDNSIWWLGYAKVNGPSIYLDISDELPGYISIVIADNGPGFTILPEEAVKPFVTMKPDGMGIGLHLTNQIMESLGGKLVFPEMEIFNIPGKYGKGAKIALAFKKEGH